MGEWLTPTVASKYGARYLDLSARSRCLEPMTKSVGRQKGRQRNDEIEGPLPT